MRYQVTMTHTDKTFEKLAHMQYDLFCKTNRTVRSLLSVGLILLALYNGDSWWGILIIAYACYLLTSTYSSANHTAHKLAKGIRESGMDFPSSELHFYEDRLEILSLQKKQDKTLLDYADVCKLGEDREYFYLFRDSYGGYMVPKDQLKEEKTFRTFLENVTGRDVESKMSPMVRLLRSYTRRQNTPRHL